MRNLSTLRQAARYIVDNYAAAENWNRMMMLRWLDWCLGEGFLITAHEAPGRPIIGLLIARPVMEATDGLIDGKFDPEGKCSWIDLVITSHPEAVKLLFLAGIRRFGMRPEVAWNNYKHHRMTAIPLSRLQRNVLRKKEPSPHGPIIHTSSA